MKKLKEFGIYYVTFWKEFYVYIKPMRAFLILWLSAVIGTMVFFSSCATKKVPFTSDLKSEYSLDEKAMKRIQFYVSEDIILVKSNGTSYLKTKDGKILLSSVKNSDVITIKKNTPCVVEGILGSYIMLVSFENDSSKTFMFGVNKVGLYSLYADEWNGKVGIVSYGNTSYATSGNSGSSYLKVKLKKLNMVGGKSKTLSGKKIVE